MDMEASWLCSEKNYCRNGLRFMQNLKSLKISKGNGKLSGITWCFLSMALFKSTLFSFLRQFSKSNTCLLSQLGGLLAVAENVTNIEIFYMPCNTVSKANTRAPWCLTFAWVTCHAGYPGFHRFRALGSLQLFLKARPWLVQALYGAFLSQAVNKNTRLRHSLLLSGLMVLANYQDKGKLACDQAPKRSGVKKKKKS